MCVLHCVEMAEERTADEILRIIENAKVHPNDLHPNVQQIHFDENFGGNERRLLELDPEVENYLQAGSSIVLRGIPGESAMICTSTSTFELKEAEMSNSLLIMNHLSFVPLTTAKCDQVEISSGSSSSEFEPRVMQNKKILGIAHSYLEMRRVKPYLGQIIHLLELSSFRGMDHEEEVDKSKLMTMDDILDQVPASINEIEQYLGELKTIEIDGYLRLVDSGYLFYVLEFLVGIADENSWNNESIIKGAAIAQLRGVVPEFILQKVFQWFLMPVVGHSSDVEDTGALTIDEETFAYKEDAICRLYGEVILKRGGQFNYREFLKTWENSVPRGLRVNENQLKDISVIDEMKSPPTIRYFPEHTLPPNTQDRLSVLFEAKAKWKHDDIMPFIANLTVSEQSASVLLTKFCRVTSPEGVKTYSARYVK